MVKSKDQAEKETTTTYRLLERSARAALELQREDGSFPPGNNGVYDEPETPVRTTSKWLITLSKVYEITENELFARAALDAAGYLLSEDVRPHGYTFHSRKTESKDKCDGLVGQSPAIRSLTYAAELFDRPDFLETAIEVFSLHPFEEKLGLWERVEITGEPLSFDRTLNHQILFASSAAVLANNNDIAHERTKCFIDNLEENIKIHDEGRIGHFVSPSLKNIINVTVRDPRRWNILWNRLVKPYYDRSDDHRMKEIGYHPVNLLGLSMIKREFPEHGIWRSNSIRRTLEFLESETYSSLLENQDISYGPMVPHLVLARILHGFSKDQKYRIKSHINKSIEMHFDTKTDLLEKNTIDQSYQSAQIAHLAHLPEIEIEL